MTSPFDVKDVSRGRCGSGRHRVVLLADSSDLDAVRLWTASLAGRGL